MNTKIEMALRESHCDERNSDHPCEGSIIINAKGVTLACKRCGSETFRPGVDEHLSSRERLKRQVLYKALLSELADSMKDP